jgi:hypothetical protein
MAPILVPPGPMQQQILRGEEFEPGELPRPFRSHPAHRLKKGGQRQL